MSDPEVTVEEINAAEFIDRLLKQKGLTDAQVAKLIGYEKASVVRLMREGRIKFPLDKVPDLAGAVGVSPEMLMNVCLQEYMPSLVEVLMRCYGPVTDNEIDILQIIRDITGDADPSITGNEHAIQKLREAFAPPPIPPT